MIDILHIEDNPADSLLVARHLHRHGMEANIVRVDDLGELTRALEEQRWDAILADYSVPRLVFRETLALVTKRLPDCPIILVSGSVGEEEAVELLKDGLWDFVLKDNLTRLCPGIERCFRDSAQRRARREAEKALQESEERFRLIAATIAEAIWMANIGQQRIVYVSPAFELIWQQSCGSLYANPRAFLKGIHREDRKRVLAEIRAAHAGRQAFRQEFRVVRPDGSVRWVLNNGLPVLEPDGDAVRYVGVAKDITETRTNEEKLRQAATVFESTQEGVMITDLHSRILAVNKAFAEITGYAESEILGEKASIHRSGRHGPEFYQTIRASLSKTGQWQGEIWSRRKSGEIYPAWLAISIVCDEHGAPTHYVSVFSDISHIKRSEEQLTHLAHFDPLTNLPNRLLLQSRLEHAINRAQRHRKQAAVLFIDLDRFKNINDSLGHVVGDQLLVEVAVRMKERVRQEDTLGRFGGDEFLVLLEPLDSPDDAALVARDLLASLQAPFHLAGGSEAFTGASIGISIFPDDGATAADLLRNADAAMYRAKEYGRDRFCFYTADMNADAVAQLELEAALRRAIERDEFVLYFQPKVDLRTGMINGAEALIRWQRESSALESPASFVPLAEKTGLIVPIGTWVLETACRQLRSWRDVGWTELRLAVNVSGRQFNSGNLPEIVADSLARNGVPAEFLEVELTESILMENPEGTVETLRKLQTIGVKVSLDDFGTGYSSFAYLSRFPIDSLKIDQSFVRDVVTEPEAAMIADSIIELAHRMGLKVVAEGVETEAQLGYLRLRNCDEGQGYLLSRPISEEAFRSLLYEGRSMLPEPVRKPAETAGGEGAAQPERRQRTILLVDDERNILSSLHRLLRLDGYRILTAGGGLEGLEMLAQHEVDVILSDQRMPGMTGVEFLRRVKSIHPRTVRIVLSGYTELQSITDAINEGAIYKFLTKPWDDNLLRANVEEAFRYKELGDENRKLQFELQAANVDLARENERLRGLLAERDCPPGERSAITS